MSISTNADLATENSLERFPLKRQINGINYLIDIAQNDAQRKEAFKLRYEIFNVELGQGLSSSRSTGLDRDTYDDYSDHLLVYNADKEQLIGCYRILPYERVKKNIGLYSATEFNLENVYRADLQLAEVGRACVHKDYRNSVAITLLWQGLACYMQHNKLNYLCGCASLSNQGTAEFAAQVYGFCRLQNLILPEHLRVYPHEKNKIKNFSNDKVININGIKRLLPPLFRGYLSIGGQIGGEPAFDPEFRVIDFFIFLSLHDLSGGSNRFLAAIQDDARLKK